MLPGVVSKEKAMLGAIERLCRLETERLGPLSDSAPARTRRNWTQPDASPTPPRRLPLLGHGPTPSSSPRRRPTLPRRCSDALERLGRFDIERVRLFETQRHCRSPIQWLCRLETERRCRFSGSAAQTLGSAVFVVLSTNVLVL